MMIRTLERTPRPVRVGAAVVGVAGMFALAGCSTGADQVNVAENESTPAASSAPAETGSTDAGTDAGTAATGAYADGSYTAEGSYATPESVETISVTLTLASDVVTAVEVTGNPQKAESERYQSEFIDGIADVVVGQNIDDLQVSRVAGSSLTSGGFNEAVDAIKADAAA